MGVDLQMPAAFKALQKNPTTPGLVQDDLLKPQMDQESLSESSADASSQQNEFDFGESERQSSGTFSLTSNFTSKGSNTNNVNTTLAVATTNDSIPTANSSPGIGISSREIPQNFGTTTSEYAKPNFGTALPPNEAARLRFASNSSAVSSSIDSDLAAQTAQLKLSAFNSTTTFTSGVDRYGFKKPKTYISERAFDEWAENYTKYMKYRETKWKALLKSNGLSTESENGGPPVRFPPESQKLRRYVRKGIPPEWRGNAWFWFAHGNEKLTSHPGLYDKLVSDCEDLKNNDTEHIERDLHRTFPDNIYFQNDPITQQESPHLKSLRRLLTAFSVYQPKIGYCQSLNFIAGNLLLVLPEEKAFWMLVIITQNYLIGLHDINLEQVNTSQGILMISVRDRLPKIWKALNLDQSLEDNFISNLPPISLCTAPWFMSLMVNVLPTETMMRIWDCFFLEGPKTLFRISLAIFKHIEPKLQSANDELEVFQLIQSAPKKLHDPEVLMKTCFRRNNGFGHISNEDIKLLRTFVQNRRKAAQEGLAQDTSDRNAYAKLHRGRRVRSKLRIYR